MKFAFSYFNTLKLRLSVEIIIKVIGTLMDLFLPLILAYIIDNAIQQSIDSNSILPVLLWGGLMIFCAFIGWLGNIIANRMSANIARDVTKRIRHDLFSKIFSISQSQVDALGTPSLIYRMSNDTYNIHQMVGMSQRLAIRAPILLIGGIFLTLTLDPILTLVLLSVLPFISIIILFVTKKSIPLYKDLQTTSDSLVTTVREDISGIRVIKALSTEEYEMERFNQVNKKTVGKELKASMTMASINPLMNLLLNLGLVGVVYFGAMRVQNGNIQPGVIIAFLHYFVLILNAMLSITRMFIIFSRASASSGRIKDIINMQSELIIENVPTKRTLSHIEFKDVSFSYLKVKNNLENINFTINKGESLGIIGATGSGKTTIINLLMRFYDVDKGNIFINGKDIKSINNRELKEKFGVVFQNDVLFSETVYENIDFGRELQQEDIINASKNAQIDKHVLTMEKGYDTILASRGLNLSGGQKQRLMIARAIVSNPEILIFDDSSSALDYKTDANLRKAIKSEKQTQIIIAQRISSIKNCTKIIILDEGKIVSCGTHNELLKSSNAYYEIFETQMGVNS